MDSKRIQKERWWGKKKWEWSKKMGNKIKTEDQRKGGWVAYIWGKGKEMRMERTTTEDKWKIGIMNY